MNIDIDELERLARAASRGPWSSSAHNAQSVGADIWCGTYPVATVTEGPWGPVYASLRLEEHDNDPKAIKAVPTLERVTHGEVPKEQAAANRSYIAAVHPDVVLELIAALRAAQAPLSFSAKLAELFGFPQRKEVKPPVVLQIADQSTSASSAQRTTPIRSKSSATTASSAITPAPILSPVQPITQPPVTTAAEKRVDIKPGSADAGPTAAETPIPKEALSEPVLSDLPKSASPSASSSASPVASAVETPVVSPAVPPVVPPGVTPLPTAAKPAKGGASSPVPKDAA